MTSFRAVLITAPAGRRAESLARGLVEARLAACVNVVPGVASHYRWEGKIRRDRESLLIVKTTARRLAALQRWIAARHPYSTPEVLSLPVEGGSTPYLEWLAAQLR